MGDGYTVLIDHVIFITIFLTFYAILGEHHLDKSKSALNGGVFEKHFSHIWLLILVCAIGSFFNVLDKYWITELRRINCLSSIRFAWLEIADQGREPVHSIVSLVGNILSSFLFPTALILVSRFFTHTHKIQMQNYLQLIAFVFLIVIYCGSFASRNLMFAFGSLCFCSSITYVFLEPTRKQFAKAIATGTLIFIVNVGFLIALTNNRIFCISEHYQRSIDLGGRSAEIAHTDRYLSEFESEINFQYEPTPASKACPGCALGAIYLNHGISNHHAIFDDNKVGKNYIWAFLSGYIKNVFDVSDFEYVRNFKRDILTADNSLTNKKRIKISP